jgi:NADH dehydrogenase FAD-containing subunit
MSGADRWFSLRRVLPAVNPGTRDPVRVVVVGGGVAGLEALIGLRELAGDRVALELISLERTFASRPLAAQQADAAAEAIAARLGVAVEPEPFTPVLRGTLLAGGEGPRVAPPAAAVGSTALWSSPAKLAGRYLSPYLAAQRKAPAPTPAGVVVELRIDPQGDQRPIARAA